jgi:type I restriction enzyme, S subunit
MGEWKEYKIADLISQKLLAIGDGYRAKNSELGATRDAGLPFARAGNIDGGFDFSDADFFPIEHLEKIAEKTSRVGDIVFTSKGTVGRFAFVNEASQQFVYSPQLCFWRSLDKDFIFPRFLFYWMQGREFLAQVDAVKGQTDMADYVNLADQRQMKITLPAFLEQHAIAEVLSSLDDKIDLLHRQNKILEALAESLFRHWYVEEADESWGKTIDELPIEIIDGDRGLNYPKNFDFFPDGYCLFLSAKNVTSRGFNFTDCSFITEAKDEKLRSGKLKRKDVLLTTRGTVGNVAFYHDKIKYDNIRINSGMVILRARSSDLPVFLYALMRTKYFSQLLQEQVSGSAQPQLPIRDIKKIKLIFPPNPLVQNYTVIIEHLYGKIFGNEAQIRTLTQLCDALLPKLMSGEARVELSNTESAAAN